MTGMEPGELFEVVTIVSPPFLLAIGFAIYVANKRKFSLRALFLFVTLEAILITYLLPWIFEVRE